MLHISYGVYNFKITFRMFEVPSEFTDSDSDLVVTDASYNI